MRTSVVSTSRNAALPASAVCSIDTVTLGLSKETVQQLLRAQLEPIIEALGVIRAKLTYLEANMATQADIDALTTALTDADAAIQQEIAKLEAANPSLDLSGLKAAVDATAALVPAATTPAAPSA